MARGPRGRRRLELLRRADRRAVPARRAGSEVILPGYTYLATWQAVRWAGMIPVVVDVDDRGLIDPDAVEAAIGPRTGAILAVHLTGVLAPMASPPHDRGSPRSRARSPTAHTPWEPELATFWPGASATSRCSASGRRSRWRPAKGAASRFVTTPSVPRARMWALQGHAPGSMDAIAIGHEPAARRAGRRPGPAPAGGLTEQLDRRLEPSTRRYRSELGWAAAPTERTSAGRALGVQGPTGLGRRHGRPGATSRASLEPRRRDAAVLRPSHSGPYGVRRTSQLGRAGSRARGSIVRDPDPPSADGRRRRPGDRRHRFVLRPSHSFMTVIGIANAGTDPLTDRIRSAVEEAAVGSRLRRTRGSRRPRRRTGGHRPVRGHSPLVRSVPRRRQRRSRRIAWFGEPLPSPGLAGRSRQSRSRVRVLAGTALVRRFLGPDDPPAPAWPTSVTFERTWRSPTNARPTSPTRAGARTFVDDVVVTSRDRARVLAASGVQGRVVPYGYHPALAGPLAVTEGADRDIAVAIVGSALDARHLRRGRVFEAILPALESLGRVAVLDGVWGLERDALLRRTRVLLDIHRIPGNFAGLRFLTAFASGAVLVTEPLDDPHPFVSGRDHIEAPTGRLVDEVAASCSMTNRPVEPSLPRPRIGSATSCRCARCSSVFLAPPDDRADHPRGRRSVRRGDRGPGGGRRDRDRRNDRGHRCKSSR